MVASDNTELTNAAATLDFFPPVSCVASGDGVTATTSFVVVAVESDDLAVTPFVANTV